MTKMRRPRERLRRISGSVYYPGREASVKEPFRVNSLIAVVPRRAHTACDRFTVVTFHEARDDVGGGERDKSW